MTPSSDDLALDRTRLAHERTMMAWVRTGISLISFGFTIYKFFDLESVGRGVRQGLLGPRVFGFAMIFTGLLAIVVSSIDHRRQLQALRAQGLKVPRSLATLLAVVVAVLGVVGLGAVIFRQ